MAIVRHGSGMEACNAGTDDVVEISVTAIQVAAVAQHRRQTTRRIVPTAQVIVHRRVAAPTLVRVVGRS
ncbi:hypothetical protein C6503_24755 [Candidatus Poribacteria bacterium]|nr:MAG: hypothetical protein C6503_24755 [Candidatus Poribacteria bacterium]